MKLVYILISLLSLVASVLAEINAVVKCPQECSQMKICFDTANAKFRSLAKSKNVKFSISVYPPENDLFGICNCQDRNAYLNCINCYFPKVNKNAVNLNQLNEHCNNPQPPKKPNQTIVESELLENDTTKPIDNTDTSQIEKDNENNDKDNDQKKDNNNVNNKYNNSNSNDGDSGGNGTVIGLAVIGAVVAVGVVGFFVYSRKKKERPETMPFFGNSATSINSQNQYSSNSLPREVNEVGSTNNLTTNYDNQFYGNTDTSQYNNNFDQSPQNYNEQYDPNYQYGEESYKVVDNNANGFATNGYGTIGYDSNVTASEINNISAPTNYDTTGVSSNLGVPNTLGVATNIVDTSQDNANYESRRESMLPGIKPTAVNVAGSFVVTYKYDPQLDDELALHVGDQIQIIEEYEDGWMKAFNVSTGQEGMAPRVCIKEA